MSNCLIGVARGYRIGLWQTIVVAYPDRHRLVAFKYARNKGFLILISFNVTI